MPHVRRRGLLWIHPTEEIPRPVCPRRGPLCIQPPRRVCQGKGTFGRPVAKRNRNVSNATATEKWRRKPPESKHPGGYTGTAGGGGPRALPAGAPTTYPALGPRRATPKPRPSVCALLTARGGVCSVNKEIGEFRLIEEAKKTQSDIASISRFQGIPNPPQFLEITQKRATE